MPGKPAEAAKARALITLLMQDGRFLALYRSGDPKVRAAAMHMLNHARHRAYGGAPTQVDDAGAGRKQRRFFSSVLPPEKEGIP